MFFCNILEGFPSYFSVYCFCANVVSVGLNVVLMSCLNLYVEILKAVEGLFLCFLVEGVMFLGFFL